MDTTLEQARVAKRKVGEVLGEVLGKSATIVGVGITKVDDEYAVKVNLSSESQEELPLEIDGVQLVIEVVGEIKKV
jgi:hypothetical protein